MEIVLYPDERLRKQCTKMARGQLKILRSATKNMYDFMLEHDGAGLAAPQVGISKQFFMIKRGLLPFGHTVAINPTWKPDGAEQVIVEEGCLSFPNLLLEVPRYSKILASYGDWRGRMYSVSLQGFAAQVFQHECDHLQGKLFVDKLSKFVSY